MFNWLEVLQTHILTSDCLYSYSCWTGNCEAQDIDKHNFIIEEVHKIITGEGSSNAGLNRLVALSQLSAVLTTILGLFLFLSINA